MTREEYSHLFHKAQVNLVAFKQVFHCDEELRKMVELAVNDKLDEIAGKIDKMPFGDTAASFAVWIREQKHSDATR